MDKIEKKIQTVYILARMYDQLKDLKNLLENKDTTTLSIQLDDQRQIVTISNDQLRKELIDYLLPFLDKKIEETTVQINKKIT